MPIVELIIRMILSYFVLLTVTRMMGRKELSQMTFFNFVSAIAIGSISATLVTDTSLSIRNGVIALAGWCLFTIILGIMDINSRNVRLAVEGEPRILIKNGLVMEDEMRKVRLDMDALNALLRQKEVFSITDVNYAIFETDGNLSVMKKEFKSPVTKTDMNIPPKTPMYPIETTIISDGKIVTSNLEELNLDQSWVEQQLQSAGIPSTSDVFYAELQKDGSLYIDKKSDIPL
ncbi:uncharacterized membrane protein YcaP (DUF421 family) [Salibacterium salarium]|uniref:YetF domain-containing protein n=1 Tax=Salibacterium salarium TaxID=284579 RepID=UPI002780DFB1|nr:DUF421 domain-containing protein [Salibacterium salarium]MDQ0300093.1 uncharacterized membrane protein YcaP (DUF421 family) [Salibacterium salarium]